MGGDRVRIQATRKKREHGCCPGLGISLGTGMEKWERRTGKGKVV